MGVHLDQGLYQIETYFLAYIAKVETDKRYQANGLLLPNLFVTQGIEVINADRKDILTFFTTSTKMLAIETFEIL